MRVKARTLEPWEEFASVPQALRTSAVDELGPFVSAVRR